MQPIYNEPQASNQAPRIAYRADIDGLRAISILGVLLFHAFPHTITGGFVGVDVFFVISGYLISSLIFKGLHNQSYSLLTFYQHRILRIFPALILVLACSFALGWGTLLSGEFKQLGKHMAAGAGFIQNFTLTMEAGYFDTASELKPLMHLWSLAIEEQFYLVYPLLIMFAWRFGVNVLAIILPIGAISFYINLVGIQDAATQTFFQPQSRFWELLLGALLAYATYRDYRVSQRMAGVCSVVGISLIIVSCLLITPKNLYPGWLALAPTGGAFLLILAGPHSRVNRIMLSNRVMRFIGKISYPLYLWHWPALTFALIVYGTRPPAFVLAALLGLSFILAWATYAYVEKPIRFGRHPAQKSLLLLMGMLVVGYVGYNTFKRDGLAFRRVNEINTLQGTASLRSAKHLTTSECGIPQEDRQFVTLCVQDSSKPIHSAVWGDSKGEALFWGLIQQQDQPFGWQLLGDVACAPMSGAYRTTPDIESNQSRCADANRVALRSLTANSEIRTVVIGTGFRVLMKHEYSEPSKSLTSEQAAWRGLSQAIAQLEQAGKHVIFVVDNPTLPDPSECMPSRSTGWSDLNRLAAREPSSRCVISYSEHLSDTARYRKLIAQLQASHSKLTIYTPDHLLCDLTKGLCPVMLHEHFLYSYTDHLSDYGSALLAKEIVKLDASTALTTR